MTPRFIAPLALSMDCRVGKRRSLRCWARGEVLRSLPILCLYQRERSKPIHVISMTRWGFTANKNCWISSKTKVGNCVSRSLGHPEHDDALLGQRVAKGGKLCCPSRYFEVVVPAQATHVSFFIDALSVADLGYSFDRAGSTQSEANWTLRRVEACKGASMRPKHAKPPVRLPRCRHVFIDNAFCAEAALWWRRTVVLRRILGFEGGFGQFGKRRLGKGAGQKMSGG